MIAFGAAVLLALPRPAFAQEILDGWFIATDQCEAFQSKNRLTNPGDVVLVEQHDVGRGERGEQDEEQRREKAAHRTRV